LPPAAGEELRAMCRPNAGKVLAARPLKSDRSPAGHGPAGNSRMSWWRTLGAP